MGRSNWLLCDQDFILQYTLLPRKQPFQAYFNFYDIFFFIDLFFVWES